MNIPYLTPTLTWILLGAGTSASATHASEPIRKFLLVNEDTLSCEGSDLVLGVEALRFKPTFEDHDFRQTFESAEFCEIQKFRILFNKRPEYVDIHREWTSDRISRPPFDEVQCDQIEPVTYWRIERETIHFAAFGYHWQSNAKSETYAGVSFPCGMW